MADRIDHLISKAYVQSPRRDCEWNMQSAVFDKRVFAKLLLEECIAKAEDYGLGSDAVLALEHHFGLDK